jgi:hypothetical protein
LLLSYRYQIDEETLKQKSDEKIIVLQEERDWFKQEALRLDQICKGLQRCWIESNCILDQQKLIDDLKFKTKMLTEDKVYYESFILGEHKCKL